MRLRTEVIERNKKHKMKALKALGKKKIAHQIKGRGKPVFLPMPADSEWSMKTGCHAYHVFCGNTLVAVASNSLWFRDSCRHR